MANFPKFHFKCLKILPAVYSDSFSYYETLCKLQESVNELGEYISAFEDEVLQKEIRNLKKYIDDQIAAVRTLINITDSKITTLNQKVNTNKALTDAAINDINGKILAINTRLGNYDTAIEQLNGRVNDIVDAVNSIEDDVTDLGETVDDNTEAIGELNSDITTINDRIDDVEDTIDTMSPHLLPNVTQANDYSFLMVINGAWSLETMPLAHDYSF